MGIYLGTALCGGTGIALLVYAVLRITRSLIFLRSSRKATGIVVGFATGKNSDRQTTYLPVIEFKTAGNRAVQNVSTVASNPPAYKVGDQIEIIFLPKSPEIARINSFSELWMLTFVILIIHFACLGIAALLFQTR